MVKEKWGIAWLLILRVIFLVADLEISYRWVTLEAQPWQKYLNEGQ